MPASSPVVSILPFAALLLPLAAAAELPRSPAPAPECMDARQVTHIHPVDAREVGVGLADGSRFRLDLAEGCPALEQSSDSLQLLAREGWACPGQPVFIADTATGTACAVQSIASVDSREFARLARLSGEENRLATIEVHGKAPRGFRGSYDYCFQSSQMRSWHEDSEGLVVEVRPRRSGGNQHYRVQLDSACTEIRQNATLALRSGAGNGLICGHAGDAVVFPEQTVLGGLEGIAASLPPAIAARCTIREVYPLASR